MLLDGVSNAPDHQKVVEHWYSNEFERVVGALSHEDPALQQVALDILAFCAHHQRLASHAFTRRTVIHSAAELLGSKHKLVVLASCACSAPWCAPAPSSSRS